jgi:Enoyl-CoA hydratase/carnithine racemase
MADYSGYKEILVSVEDRIATVKLNRPQFGNAFGDYTADEIVDAFEKLGKDPAVGSIVLTGEGKLFSAGGDINKFKDLIAQGKLLNPERTYKAGKMVALIRRTPKPVIASVNGAAAGAGLGIALAADFRVATPKTKFVCAFINVGVSGDGCCMYNLVRIIGTSRAIDLAMTGRRVGGEEAYQMGLVSRLAPEGELEKVTYELAKQLANQPLYAIGRQKEQMNALFFSDLEKSAAFEAAFNPACSGTKDFAEATNAFLEKRTPVFTGE